MLTLKKTFNVQGGLSLVLCLFPLAQAAIAQNTQTISTISFGSCEDQNRIQNFWDPINAHHPDAFIFMGDNIYADTTREDVLKEEYARLAAQPGFQKLKASSLLLETWDDHDFGENDAGGDFSFKDISRKVFFDFWGIPADSPRRAHQGVYDAATIGPPGRRVQVILLDLRYFRSPLKRVEHRTPGEGPYLPDTDPTSTMLGEAQWTWLEKQLREPADLRLLISSVQLVANEHGWEKWDNFPLERTRLFNLIRTTGAQHLIVLSGDRHRGEISIIKDAVGYPLYDVTSSGLNMVYDNGPMEPNRYRAGELIAAANFGVMTIDWEKPDPEITLQLRDMDDKVRAEQKLKLGDLKFTSAVRTSD